MGLLAELVGSALDLVLPPHCCGCGCGIRSGWWCGPCGEALRPIHPPRCETCSHPFDGLIEGIVVCPNCRGRPFHFEFGVAVVPSRGAVRELVHSLKYGGREWAAKPLGALCARGLGDPRLASKPDALVPVPLHAVRRRERGFNQAELIAAEVSKLSGIPILNALARKRATVTQTHFERRERLKNLRGAFCLQDGVCVRDRDLLLVDDVLTTGATLDECARVLVKSGAARLRALTVARG